MSAVGSSVLLLLLAPQADVASVVEMVSIGGWACGSGLVALATLALAVAMALACRGEPPFNEN